mmetsp:Transcript_27550/g.80434  ORF Transcript_27550/g.80434 Transcript_27550/m.80434 type:complete len:228 (+) Transcript_27550:1288-1971(+)
MRGRGLPVPAVTVSSSGHSTAGEMAPMYTWMRKAGRSSWRRWARRLLWSLRARMRLRKPSMTSRSLASWSTRSKSWMTSAEKGDPPSWSVPTAVARDAAAVAMSRLPDSRTDFTGYREPTCSTTLAMKDENCVSRSTASKMASPIVSSVAAPVVERCGPMTATAGAGAALPSGGDAGVARALRKSWAPSGFASSTRRRTLFHSFISLPLWAVCSQWSTTFSNRANDV